tara:strand:+ start:436 stop:1161 length:726 start_codon:yes stop_codon:yes gene_type:complete
MIRKLLNDKNLKYIYLGLLVTFVFLIYKNFDINYISNLFEISQNNISSISIYSIILLFILRSFSIVIPIIPGTYCSVLAGYLYGVKYGLLLMFIADFLSCSISFFLSRRFGRDFISKLLGQSQMKKVESISQKYIENNFFLMTGLLLTSWFDFVCYAVGLTKISWKKFMPALILSIIISDLPFVSAGYTLRSLSNINLQMILNGEVTGISGNSLLLLVSTALLIFGLGFLKILLRKQKKKV